MSNYTLIDFYNKLYKKQLLKLSTQKVIFHYCILWPLNSITTVATEGHYAQHQIL